MPIVTVAEHIAAPADRVWDHISWHGLQRLTGGLFQRIEFFGDMPEPGITKRIHFAEGMPVLERLESVDECDRTYRYRVIDAGSLPVTDYSGYVRVTPCGPDACHLKIECEFTTVLVTETEWGTTWRAMESSLIDQIRGLVGAATPAA